MLVAVMADLLQILKDTPSGPTLLLQASELTAAPRWLLFQRPLATLATRRVEEVAPVLEEATAQVEAGRWAAGFISYEAAPAFDPSLAAYDPGPLPLTWWGIFDAPREVALSESLTGDSPELDWQPAISQASYGQALERIRDRIAMGDTYQVNFTFPLTAPCEVEPEKLFAAMVAAQRSRYSAYLDLGRFALCSASPELFFALDGERVTARPMKGTARRGRYPEEDLRMAAELQASEKNRAENLMIVDMMRNDLGRVAEAGSVKVDELFAVEKFPTVHQLTSTVRARTRATPLQLLRALFPSASITGAPKIATSRLIRELESGPRGIYTGSIGCFAPGRRAQLNVAIRTAMVDRERRVASYGTGGGIVWDSEVAAEFEECRAKALVLRPAPPDFGLLETLLWRPRSGYAWLQRHLERLTASAHYFGFALQGAAVAERLEREAATFEAVRHRVRLVAYRDGRLEVSAQPWACEGRTSWSIVLDDRPIDDSDPFFFHKTTRRQAYDEALNRHPEADEVVLWNARGELTESTRANLVLEIEGHRWTPPVACGLLPGTYRAELLARGRIREKILPISALERADEVFLINSLRGWIRTRRASRGVGAARLDAVRR
ncbi:MAG: aminodeoxychorismate synthase component I [Acidobacteriota bacterium]